MIKPKSHYWWAYLLVSSIGLLDSIYLLWIKIANDKSYCIQGIGDCWAVNSSKYSMIFGIPVSLVGIVAYALILVVFLFENRYSLLQANGIYILFGLTTIGILYSAYLTYIELFVIYAICPFCVVSAAAMVVLFIMTIVRLVKYLR